MDLLSELARLQAENAALRDRVGKLEAAHEAAKKYWSIPAHYRCFPGKSATYIAACRDAGVEP